MQFQKVTNPAKIVTDPVMLALLAKQDVHKDGVELWHDYASRSSGKCNSPFTKFYRDLNSNQRYMVVSGLPMVDAYGQGHELVWWNKAGSMECGNNIFHAVVEKNNTRLIALSDQPDGTKKDCELFFHPQLYIDGGEIQPVSPLPVLLETDPVNPGYHDNVLEWDYGVCRRRLRIIEGKFLGSWVFTCIPRGDVLVRYNQRGDFKLRLQHARNNDEECFPRGYFAGKEFPVIIEDNATFYPDANPETATVDGIVGDVGNTLTWPELVVEPGSVAYDNTANSVFLYITSSTTTNRFEQLYRSIFLFNTGDALPDEANINAATLSLYGNAKDDTFSVPAAPDIDIFASAPASNTALVGGDFDSFGAVPFCDTPVSYASFNTGGYNNFILNTAGIAAISRTGVTKLGARNANHDASEIIPTWSSAKIAYLKGYFAEQGTGYKPKLVVTYTEGVQKNAADSGAGAELISVRTLSISDQGSGVEASLAALNVFTGDAGNGYEIGGLLQSHYGCDAGGAADSLKLLSIKSGMDIKLRSGQGKVGIPHKEVNL
jgi:hypothetical protein